MKTVSGLFRRLQGTFAKGENKKGASLALVMIICTVLVVFVMCILPLMTTTGTITYQTMGEMDDYLGGRSAIEYCKSELEHIVQNRVPYTFAITGSLEERDYTVIPKLHTNGSGSNSAYTTLIAGTNQLDDRTDAPRENVEAAKDVVAICAVELENNVYDIQITTWLDGEKTMTYTATFTPRGSLRIFPEAYGEKQALPLSDFVVVDGQLGKYEIWESDIGNHTWTDLGSITETLLPWIDISSPEWSDRYANAGRYPAVFKTTAHAASSGNAGGILEPINDKLTEGNWIVPVGISYNDRNNAVPGNIWMDGNTVYMMGLTDRINITDRCVVFYNGYTSGNNSAPTKGGIYQVTIDFDGYISEDESLCVLSYDGLALPDLKSVSMKTAVNKLTDTDKEITVTDVERIRIRQGREYKYYLTVTLSLKNNGNKPNPEGLMYGCISGDKNAEIVWQEDNVFENLSVDKDYYFYVCRPAYVAEDGTVYSASEVDPAGAIIIPEYVTSMQNGSYMITNDGADKCITGSLQLGGTTKFNNGEHILVDDQSDLWTFKGSNNKGSLMNDSGKYLNLSYKNWSYTVSLSDEMTLNFAFSGSGTKVSVGSNNNKATLYINGNSVTASKNGSYVRFIRIPEYPEVPSASATYRLTSYSAELGAVPNSLIGDRLTPNDQITKLYINSADAPNYLDAGVYNMMVVTKMDDGRTNAGIVYNENKTAAGILTVRKADLADDVLAVSAIRDEVDELTVHVSNSNWHEASKGGARYFGYRKLNDVTDSEFHWFPAEDDQKSFTFRLDHGEYIFAVRESGSNNYNGMIKEADKPITITYRDVDLSGVKPSDFTYSYSGGKVTWYKLPEGVLPNRVTLVFGLDDGRGGIIWTTEDSDDTSFYGVIIKNSRYDSIENVLKISPPIGITTNDEHMTSMLRGSSIYFMGLDGNNASIETHGNDIYLTSDMLVLRGGIHGGGEVIVEPYTRGDGTDYTLLINPEPTTIKIGQATLEADTVYKIDPNKDLNSLTDDYLNSEERKIGTLESDEVKYLFRQGAFEEINLDIAYAESSQLARIVSSETVQWTNQGKLGSTNADNEYYEYAICAYISEITADADNCVYVANRVLIAGETESGEDALVVPYPLNFALRYLSIDTAKLIQQNGSSSKFMIYNLEPKKDWITEELEEVGIFDYTSRSLQVDYERYTKIIPGAEEGISPQICRYDDGTDLFASPVAQPLTIEYDNDELVDGDIIKQSKIVERYITVSGGDLSLSALGKKKLYLYTNYIHFDDTVKKISALSILSGDVIINCQEAGYGASEYLFYYRDNSPEKYKGTLVYFENNVRLQFLSVTGLLGGNIDVTIPKGFYYIYSKEGGTSIKELADLFDRDRNPLSENKDQKPYRVYPEELTQYSIYVNEDGTLSDAFVDTGLEDYDSSAVGGFSGGNMG